MKDVVVIDLLSLFALWRHHAFENVDEVSAAMGDQEDWFCWSDSTTPGGEKSQVHPSNLRPCCHVFNCGCSTGRVLEWVGISTTGCLKQREHDAWSASLPAALVLWSAENPACQWMGVEETRGFSLPHVECKLLAGGWGCRSRHALPLHWWILYLVCNCWMPSYWLFSLWGLFHFLLLTFGCFKTD